MDTMQTWFSSLPSLPSSALATGKNFLENVDLAFQPRKVQEEEEYEEDEGNGHMSILPWEVVHHIFTFLSPRDLCVLAEVSYDWFVISCDDSHWKRLFHQDKYMWQIYVNPSKCRLSSWQKLSNITKDIKYNIATQVSGILSNASTFISSPNGHTTTATKNRVVKQLRKNHKWKSYYTNEHIENSCCDVMPIAAADTPQPQPQPQAADVAKKGALPSLNGLWKLQVPFTKKAYRVPMLGSGLETSAKDLLYTMMWGKHIDLPLTGLYPGVDGVGSGVGFDVNGVNLNIAALYRCDFSAAYTQWNNYFQDVDAAIFVINGACANATNHTLLELYAHVPKNTPLLVLLLNDNLPSEENTAPTPAALVAEQLELADVLQDGWWSVRHVNMQNLEGMQSGLQWLASLV